jgi:hypothetical protein
MIKRETHKIVEIAGRKWRIGRFDALTGSYISFKILTQLLPMLLDAKDKPDSDMANALASGLMSGKQIMSKDEFLSLQRDCLAICSEIVTVAGAEAPVAVLLPNGSWGVADIEFDVMTVMGLTIHALMFNISSFFGGNTLKEATAMFQGISLFDVKP